MLGVKKLSYLLLFVSWTREEKLWLSMEVDSWRPKWEGEKFIVG